MPPLAVRVRAVLAGSLFLLPALLAAAPAAAAIARAASRNAAVIPAHVVHCNRVWLEWYQTFLK